MTRLIVSTAVFDGQEGRAGWASLLVLADAVRRSGVLSSDDVADALVEAARFVRFHNVAVDVVLGPADPGRIEAFATMTPWGLGRLKTESPHPLALTWWWLGEAFGAGLAYAETAAVAIRRTIEGMTTPRVVTVLDTDTSEAA